MNMPWAQTFLTTVNWLWVAGAAIAAWMIVGAMSRRQARLTELLREHVTSTQAAQEAAAEAAKKKSDAKSDSRSK